MSGSLVEDAFLVVVVVGVAVMVGNDGLMVIVTPLETDGVGIL